MPTDEPTDGLPDLTVAGLAVDAHQHVWDVAVRPQPWTDDLPVLRRSFSHPEVVEQMTAAGVRGAVLVHTLDVAAETTEMLALATRSATVLGVVGWADLTAVDLPERLGGCREQPGGLALVGLRHQVQHEGDPAWLTRPDVARGLDHTGAAGLAFDLVVTPAQWPAVLDVARRHPAMRLVLDHAGKPLLPDDLKAWMRFMSELACYEQVVVKLSGLGTQVEPPGWRPDLLRQLVDRLLDLVGPQRVMAGSDWPVTLLAGSYADAWAATRKAIAGLSAAEQQDVLAGTAVRTYGLAS